MGWDGEDSDIQLPDVVDIYYGSLTCRVEAKVIKEEEEANSTADQKQQSHNEM